MTFFVSNGQYTRGHGRWNAQAVDVGDPVDVVEESRFVWCQESFRGLFNSRRFRGKVFITSWTRGQVGVGVSQRRGVDYKRQHHCIRS